MPNSALFGRRGVLSGVGLAAGASQIAPPAAASASADSKAPPYTIQLAEYAAGLRYDDIPDPVKQRIKNCITDTVAVILFGGQLPWSHIVIAHAKRYGRGGQSAILGTGETVHAPSAALAHGAMAHAFEMDNLTDPNSGSHPGAVLFSSGLALAQERGLSGRALITAMTAGAEVMIRVGRAANGTLEPHGFHAPGTTGPFGAAVTAGSLMGFGAAKMTNALGIAGSASAGLLEFAHSNTGAMVKRLHLGRAAESGVLAASLAADGFTGPVSVLEGGAGYLHDFCTDPAPAELTKGLGTDYAAMSVMMKRFACHITAHRPVEAILDLKAEHGFSGNDVASVVVTGNGRMATANNIPAPADILLAQYSIPFSVALSLFRNPVDPASFAESAVRDPDIMGMAARVKMVAAEGQKQSDLTATVEVTLKDGRVLSRRAASFLGTPARPLDRAGLKEKFMLQTKRFPAAQMERLFERLQSIENEPTLEWIAV
jgi:2-methylcitrate dehydratase PrpD